jgi:uncharacterized protein YwbE
MAEGPGTLHSLPVEIQFEIVRFLPPEAIINLREQSKTWRDVVDAIVMETRFTDPHGIEVGKHVGAGERLNRWREGLINHPDWPRGTRPETKADIIQDIDKKVGELTTAVDRTNWLASMVNMSETLPPKARIDLQRQLSTYFKHLRDTNRLTDQQGEFVNADVAIAEILHRMRQHQLEWVPPPPIPPKPPAPHP